MMHGQRNIKLMNQNYVQEEIKSILNSDDACYHSVQNLLSSRLLSKNIKITITTNTVLSFALYGCEAWSLSLFEGKAKAKDV